MPWDELVSFAMDFWEQADVEAALGAELTDALPELLQLDDLAMRIPRGPKGTPKIASCELEADPTAGSTPSQMIDAIVRRRG